MQLRVWGWILSFAGVFLVLGLAGLLKKKLALQAETSRKLVHILLSNWILLALYCFSTSFDACLVPACFVVINYISWRRSLFSSIERESDRSLGTVWYALSLLLLCWFGFGTGMPYVAACGILSMGYADGLAAVVGRRWGRHPFPGRFADKSVEGSVCALVFTALAVGAVCLVYAPHIALQAAGICAVTGSALELVSPAGTDNLSVPLGTALVVFVLARAPQFAPLLACAALTALIALGAWALRALTAGGAWAAAALGLSVFVFGGWRVYTALLVFFLLGNAAGRVGTQKKRPATGLHEHRGARSAAQVIANGGPALLFALLYFLTGLEPFLPAAIACLAGAAADTCSSEIGMLSDRQPVALLGLRPVDRGMSGGVTALGLCGAALGSLPVALLALRPYGGSAAAVAWFWGFCCSLIDSALGSAQAKYRLPKGGLTERPELGGQALPLADGAPWLRNDLVNLLSGLLCGAGCALTLGRLSLHL